MGQKIEGALSPFRGGAAASPSNTMLLGSRPTSLYGILVHPAIWPQQIWAENWGLCPFGEGGAVSPCIKMWPGPRPTCVPSFMLIQPTVWPQHTNVTYRQDRLTDRQRSDSIGRTVLQTVAKAVRPMLSDRCPVCLSVCLYVRLVYSG